MLCNVAKRYFLKDVIVSTHVKSVQKFHCSRVIYNTTHYREKNWQDNIPMKWRIKKAQGKNRKTKVVTTANQHSNESISDVLDEPIDDVYLKSLYKPKIYNIDSAISTLKKIAQLDFVDSSSYITMKVNIDPQGRKKTKKINIYKTFSLPNTVGHINKVAVFTNKESNAEIAMQHGAVAAGGVDLFIQLSMGRVKPDAFICTLDMEKQIKSNQDLIKRFGKSLPSTNKGDVTDEFLPVLKRYRTNTISHNFDEPSETKFFIGRLDQTNEELKENILEAIAQVDAIKPNAKFVQGAAISCFTEYLPFHVELYNENDK